MKSKSMPYDFLMDCRLHNILLMGTNVFHIFIYE